MAVDAPQGSMRERFREQVREDVKAAALAQLAAGGAHAISINAIAKQLGVSGSALYRYFANRDELLTALVIDAYHDLRDALAHALESCTADQGPADRIGVVARAYRAWAVAEPHRYELLYRSPLPGYDPHIESVAAAARPLMAVLLVALHGLDLPDQPSEPSGVEKHSLEPYRNEEVLAERGVNSAQFRLGVSVWSRLHGIVSLELGGAFSAMELDPDALFENEVRVLVERIEGA